jgi:hypothetical protein
MPDRRGSMKDERSRWPPCTRPSPSRIPRRSSPHRPRPTDDEARAALPYTGKASEPLSEQRTRSDTSSPTNRLTPSPAPPPPPLEGEAAKAALDRWAEHASHVAAESAFTIAAWGAHAEKIIYLETGLSRHDQLLAMLRTIKPVRVVRVTPKTQVPGHPLYVPRSTLPTLYV